MPSASPLRHGHDSFVSCPGQPYPNGNIAIDHTQGTAWGNASLGGSRMRARRASRTRRHRYSTRARAGQQLPHTTHEVTQYTTAPGNCAAPRSPSMPARKRYNWAVQMSWTFVLLRNDLNRPQAQQFRRSRAEAVTIRKGDGTEHGAIGVPRKPREARRAPVHGRALRWSRDLPVETRLQVFAARADRPGLQGLFGASNPLIERDIRRAQRCRPLWRHPRHITEDELELNKVELPGERFQDDGWRIHAATAFRAADGQMIVEYPYRWWAYSPDGVSFRELSTVSQQWSQAKGIDRELLAYEDPYAARTGWLFVRRGDYPGDLSRYSAPIQVELDGVSFTEVDAPTEILLLPLPPMRVAEYAYWRPSSRQVIYLSRRRYPGGGGGASGGVRDIGSEKLFVGDAGDLFAGGIAELIDPRTPWALPDTIGEYPGRYQTAEGTLSVPNGNDLKKRRAATWEGEQLVELMLERLVIVETDDRVRLCLNPGHSSWDATTYPQTSHTIWDELMADAQAWRPVQPLLADLRDPVKRAQATIDLGPDVELMELVEVLCPAQSMHLARFASALQAGISHLLATGRLERRVLISIPEDARAAVILERFRHVEVLSMIPAERDGEPAIEVTCLLTADTAPTAVRLHVAIRQVSSPIDPSTYLEYEIYLLEAENARHLQ